MFFAVCKYPFYFGWLVDMSVCRGGDVLENTRKDFELEKGL